MRPAFWIASALTGLTAAFAWWAWMSLPAGGGLPVNYLGLDGLRHQGVSREALWIVPFVSLMVTTALSALVFSRRAETAEQSIEMTMIAVAGVLLVTENALIGRALDPAFNVLKPVAVAVAVLLLAVGNYVGKARRNAAFGLRTPWTLADATVWDKTHRFTGRAMFVGGAVLLVLGFMLSKAEPLGAAIAVCAATPMILGVVASRGYARAARAAHG